MRKFKRIDAPGMERLLKAPVVIEEKYNVYPVIFSLKGPNVLVEAPKGIAASAADYLTGLKDKLVRGWTYYAGQPFGYPVKARNELMLFDIERALPSDWVGWSHRDMVADALELDCPHLLFEGITHAEALTPLLHEPSSLGGGSVSGLVIKAYGEPDSLVGKLEGLV